VEERYIERFTPAMLAEALAHYAGAPDTAQDLGGFENFIYQFEREGQPYILRLAHSSRRDHNLIQAEVDWINYLADHGVSVAAAIQSDQGSLVETIEDGHGEAFMATAFELAPGRIYREADEWKPALYERYGELLGSLHALTQDYQPPSAARRHAWDDPVMDYTLTCLPPSETAAAERYKTAKAQAQALPREKDAYGLLHYDAHKANILVTEAGVLTLIDFDDAAYAHFIFDIAIVLYHSTAAADDREAEAAKLLPPFLTGYARRNRLDPAWLDHLPLFLKLREIDLYAVIHRDFDVNNIEHPRVARFMDGRKERIEVGMPYLEMDFANYKQVL
jgi:Ser/Thr protein kinase RdoA (MazF antagonist)